MKYNIRLAKREEMDYFVDWAANEGWNPGLHDADPFYDTDPKGFFVGEYNGSIVGAISAVAYDDTFGFIGFYIVHEDHRNTVLAPLLARNAKRHLSTQNIGLDGVFEKVDSYKNIGFNYAYRNLRFEGKLDGRQTDRIIPVPDIPLKDILE